jgi:hypothetical protein
MKMNRKKVAERLVFLAKELMNAGEVPEAFKEQWKKNKKSAASWDSPYKSKLDLDTTRRDLEHRSIRVLSAALSLGPNAKLIKESLLTYSEGTSHKFHFFALYNDNGRWKSGNARGRIGGEPKAMMIGTGDEATARGAYDRKLRAKLAKGYQIV